MAAVAERVGESAGTEPVPTGGSGAGRSRQGGRSEVVRAVSVHYNARVTAGV